MANKRQLVKRRKAVRNIRKITRTMQLIATARFQAMFKRVSASKPYSEKLAEMVNGLAGLDVELPDSLLEAHSETPRDATVVITSNRGLCGGYNANVMRTAIEHIDRMANSGTPCDVQMVGKKGIQYFRFLKRAMTEVSHLGDTPKFEMVEPMANELMARFRRGEATTVHVAFMRFHSMGRQRPEVVQLLPLAPQKDAGSDSAGGDAGAGAVQYDFSPEPGKLLEELLPATVRIRLFTCFLEAAVSEQIARMVAMKAATDAAGDMIKSLTTQYNRARQTSITMELLDIIGGAAAVQ
ncbi:MAG: ATP synthase F1 subunit gamma [Phycisphaerae bacterium]|nr:MAG: ATP synthase F1 subunit gamma [Planctomycetota bacterium]KAB2948898.1 MAG: ATP synthase F1 subunit gamma [Phycisphaerae bacterium]MBE7457947.1 ATP synthase F1 subunit gamma [Planctomycetia bacterium]MCK6465550.1 ATP synthase F1 subunit gamma [Phycisphaerae bacterium]MCL4719841.1 ATP synthase F1 subunit gamma [Phycisphaerae bacterium]